jgi:phage terminase small subunit
MGVPKRLTEMQQRFAEYLVFGGPEGPVNKSEAAELAGYSKKRCRQEGSELTNPRLSPLVVKHIDELKQERMLKFGVTYESHIAELARIKDLAYLLHTRSRKNRTLRKSNRTIIIYIVTGKDSNSLLVLTKQPTFTYRCC